MSQDNQDGIQEMALDESQQEMALGESQQEVVLGESQHTELVTDLDNDENEKVAKLLTSQSFDETKASEYLDVISRTSFSDGEELGPSAPLYVSSFTFDDSPSPSTTNLGPLQTASSPPPQYLSVPACPSNSTNKKNIARSVSSASVLQNTRERKFLEKETIRKHSLAGGDEMATLFPPSLGDVQSSSMPTLSKKADKVCRHY